MVVGLVGGFFVVVFEVFLVVVCSSFGVLVIGWLRK